nr:MAG TPA: hypothetical protein [Caudoviricetes sp.]
MDLLIRSAEIVMIIGLVTEYIFILAMKKPNDGQ